MKLFTGSHNISLGIIQVLELYFSFILFVVSCMLKDCIFHAYLCSACLLVWVSLSTTTTSD
jgi:hypothetical protein